MRGEEQFDLVDARGAVGDRTAPDLDALRVLGLADLERHARVRHREGSQFRSHRRCEALGGLRPRVGQRLGKAAQFTPQRVPLGGQFVDALVVAVEFGQPRGTLLGVREHGGDVRAVLPGERVQGGPALLNCGQPQRIGVQVVGVARQLPCHIAQKDADLTDPVGERGQFGVVRAYGLQGPLRTRDEGCRVDALGVLGVAA